MIEFKECNIFDSGADYIVHQVNCKGVMGSGLAKQVKINYPEVYRAYKYLCETNSASELLGRAQFVDTRYKHNTEFRGIINLFAQDGYGYSRRYTDYEAMRTGLKQIAETFKFNSTAKIAIPYNMGCCRGGGDWNLVFSIIQKELSEYDIIICSYNIDNDK